MNSEFDAIGKTFVTAYYQCFDKKQTRPDCLKFYHPSQGMLTFEGDQCFGPESIMKRLTVSLAMNDIRRVVTTVDCQPTLDGGVLVNVLGQLKSDEENDKAMPYTQVFLLRPDCSSWFIAHDIFRLAIHNFAAQ